MRLVYFFYFLLNADYKKVWQSIKCQKKNHNSFFMFADAIWCALYYGTSLNDYFNFRFFEKKHNERNQFASTLFMYKFHKALNNKRYIAKIDNKAEFRKYFNHLANDSEIFDISSPANVEKILQWIKNNNYFDLVIKDPCGTTGTGVHFAQYQKHTGLFKINDELFNAEEVCKKFAVKNQIYIEPGLKQHHALQKLAPNALNTIRVITVLKDDNEVDIISAAIRISVDSNTDNFSTGNLAATIDVCTGIVISNAKKRMAACSPDFEKHPVTNEKIKAFKIPKWEEVTSIVNEAARIIPEVKTVGWDVAVLENKVVVIEGNPKWNKGVPQIPMDKGIKADLLKYISS